MLFLIKNSPSIDKDISSIKSFGEDIHKSLKYVDEFSVLKNDEIQKEHDLSLSTCRSIENVVQKPMRTIKWGFSISQ